METGHFGKVLKVGTSLMVTIPGHIVRGLNIKRGNFVRVGVASENEFYYRVISDIEMRELKPKVIKY